MNRRDRRAYVADAYDGDAGSRDAPGEDADDELDVGLGVPVDGPETVAEKRLLASLSHRARAVNLARVVRLVELLDACEAGVLDEPGRSEAENLAHQVVGSAGTFGFPAASVDAVGVEEHFASRAAGSVGVVGDAAVVRRTLDRLRGAFRA